MNNFVGKMLVVLNLVFSICFMCFAGAVYTYQDGWRKEAEKKRSDLQAEKTLNEQLKSDFNNQLSELQQKLDLKNQREDVEATSIADLQQSLASERSLRADADQQAEKLRTDLTIAQAEADSRNQEAVNLRGEVKNLLDRINQLVAERRSLEDTSLELTKKITGAESREVAMHEDIARLSALLRINGIDPNQAVIGTGPQEIIPVDGKVEGSRRNSSNSQEFVLISIGQDDGVQKDMRMTVFRSGKFVCDIVITDVQSDKAVGLVLEETRNGTIERGDNVTTKL
ncbi:MAG: hypothetical protein KDA96_05320 [Planctomycetaceae bacterium]|nr:hypothetical protein [Planctomycetaceae bacterium]